VAEKPTNIDLPLLPYKKNYMNRLRGMAILMGVVMLAITGFQAYWLRDNYMREEKTLLSRTDDLFHVTLRDMKDSILDTKIQLVLKDSGAGAIRLNPRMRGVPSRGVMRRKEAARFISILGQSLRTDSLRKSGNRNKSVVIGLNNPKDSLQGTDFRIAGPGEMKETVIMSAIPSRRASEMGIDSLAQNTRRRTEGHSLSYTVSEEKATRQRSTINTIYLNNDKGNNIALRLDSLINDSIGIPELEDRFAVVLRNEKLVVPFRVERLNVDSIPDEEYFAGGPFGMSAGYELHLGSTSSFLLQRISWPIIFSIFLVGITVFSFVLLYRSLLRQHRLALMKSDLVSNITHELKTPIATVGVAIEALKNFNAINDPQKTKEYLDISQSELQRLGLLVDKVLKLSMFESKSITIKHEDLNLEEVVNEVVTSLKLQADKSNTRISVISEGGMNLRGDRLHLLSVVFNLLDNAMKYSKDNASILVETKATDKEIVLKVTDNGIGIPEAYKGKIFEKFFRVPTGDTHNAKGHGLGLSYVSQVVRQHGGTIDVSSQEGIGSTFTITLPKQRS
jgi:two-component system phosphate regulon sensor histidine kinase PhoR